MTTQQPKDPMNTAGSYPHPSPEMLKACAEAFAFEALADTVRPDIKAIEAELLQVFNFEESRTGERITDAKYLYLANDGDDMTAYYNQRHEKILAAGYKVKKDHCPLLIAEHRKMEAEKRLMLAQWQLLEATGHISDAQEMYDGCLCSNKLFKEAVDLGKRFTAAFITNNTLDATKRKAFKAVRGSHD